MPRRFTLKQKIGALIYDLPRLLACTRRGRWVHMRNRNDRVTANAEGAGVVCEWDHTRTLHLCDVFPSTARRLLRCALRERPMQFRDAPEHVTPAAVCRNDAEAARAETPRVSFLIGHRGTERFPQLQLVLKSIAAQADVPFECIVVEQDTEARIRDRLPAWVRYVHTPLPTPGMLYCRSWALNVAARYARGDILICQDNDMLAPAELAGRVADIVAGGYEVVQPARFVFYLTQGATRACVEAGELVRDPACSYVLQNVCGGGLVALTREAFEAIGGWDESFVGWGGEDLDFWGRALTRTVWKYGHLPLVHLAHPAQPGRRAVRGLGHTTAELTERRLAMAPEERIAELTARERGSIAQRGGAE